jgi:short-subunit dehydrogenase
MATSAGSTAARPGTRPKVAIVTGGSGGIGLELCKVLRQDGYETYSLARSLPKNSVSGVIYIDCDITSARKVSEAIMLVRKPIDLLVNNAAVHREGTITGISEEAFNDLVNVNIGGSWRMIKNTWRHLAPNGTILQVSSERAIYPRSDAAIYGLTKMFALEMVGQLSDFAAKEGLGITVKAALLGPVRTKMLESLGEEKVKRLEDITLTPGHAATLMEKLINSDYQILRFDDPREPDGTGEYVLEDFNDGRRESVAKVGAWK